MGFFGSELVSKGLISKEDLVTALVTQSEQLYSPIRIAFEDNLLNPQQILEVILSKRDGESFASASKRLGMWSPEIEKTVAEKQKKDRKPLGQILVEDHSIDLSTISLELAKSDQPPQVVAPAMGGVDNVSEIIEGQVFSFSKVSGETKKQYLDFFSSDLKDELSQVFQLIDTSSDDSSLKNIEETIQQIAAAASFARMEVSFTLGDKLSKLVDMIAYHPDKLPVDRTELKKVCLTTLDVLWELHRFIDVSGSEEEFWANEISRANFATAIHGLDSLLAS